MKTETNIPENITQKKRLPEFKTGKTNVAVELCDLFINELKSIFGAEKLIVTAMPVLIGNASGKELVHALTSHLQITLEHETTLKRILLSIGEKAEATSCEAMESILKETHQITEKNEKGVVRDAGIVSVFLKVEHYEIATYGTLCSYAKTLGENKAANLLHKILDQEKDANQQLSQIIESIQFDMVDTLDVNNTSVVPIKQKHIASGKHN